VEEHFVALGKPITVAVMGCVVNGPGESRDADIGLAAGKGKGAIFRKGEVVRIVQESEFMSALVEEGRKVIAERFGEDEEPGAVAEERGDEIISLMPIEASPTLPGRAARRG
jgi:4-hydroxy-3-methylbut-2-en-1-yl diphosphate synthase IspG/GcpE